MRKSLLVLLAVVVGAYVAYKWAFPTFSWRQEMTIEVEIDGSLVSASGVVEHRIAFSPHWFPSNGHRHPSMRGEALVADLGKGKYLFALLQPGALETERIYQDIFYESQWKPRSRGNLLSSPYNQLKRTRDVRPVPRKYYPTLVTFTDINDPKTVQRVDPDNLAATFGAGYRLKSITLQITSEPITKGRVEKLLGWLGPHPEPSLGRSTDIFKPVFAASVKHGDFRR